MTHSAPRIIKLRRTTTSAYKNAYLMMFMGMLIHTFVQLYRARDSLIAAFKLQAPDTYLFLVGLVFLYAALTCHVFRIYVTMERLEDPTSDEHATYYGGQ